MSSSWDGRVVFFCGTFVDPTSAPRARVRELDSDVRKQYTEAIDRNGGTVSDTRTITDSVTHVIVGPFGGGLSKHRERQIEELRARGCSVVVMSVDEFFAPPVSTLLTDVYAPRSVSDIVGQKRIIVQMEAWLQRWKPGEKKAILLCGTAGIGKTTMTHLIARDQGFRVLEFNASDVRNKAAISSVVGNAARGHGVTLGGETCRQCIVMDEVDGLSSGDAGGDTALVSVIQTSMIPIICICNDKFASSLRILKPHCHVIDVYKPTPRDISTRLQHIVEREHVTVSPNDVYDIAAAADGDMRQAITLLQMHLVTSSSSSALSHVDKSVSPFDAVKRITKFKAPYTQREEAYWSAGELMPMFIHENYVGTGPRASLDSIAHAADCIALGDQFDAAAFGALFSTSSVHAAVSSIIPAAIVAGNAATRISFPKILGEESKRRAAQKSFASINNAFCRGADIGDLSLIHTIVADTSSASELRDLKKILSLKRKQ